MKRLLVDSMPNMRDIGGYKTKDGYIKYGKYIRSNTALALSEEDLDFLKKYNVSAVIDLRRDDEIEKDPSAFLGIDGIDYKKITVYETGAFTRDIEVIAKEYLNIMESKKEICEIFKIFSNCEGCVIYNCTSGKDRTGVLTAILMLALGVSKEDIAYEYSLTTEVLADTIRYNFKLDKDYEVKSFFPAYEEVMLELIELFEEKYGNIYNYLNIIGITDEDIKRLIEKSIETNDGCAQ